MADGLYKRAFSNEGMNEDRTNAHWKREQDNYLSQIGAMALIKRDPNASLGYDIRSANPNRTLEMGSGVDPKADGMYGMYQFVPGRQHDRDYTGPRFDGTLDVSVNQPPDSYGQTVAHELGHVGSRNSQSDSEIVSNAREEERRQRITDLANGGDTSPLGWEARAFLIDRFGMTVEQIDKEVDERRRELGLKGDPRKVALKASKNKKKNKPPKPTPKPLRDSASNQFIDPEYANAPSWMPQEGID